MKLTGRTHLVDNMENIDPRKKYRTDELIKTDRYITAKNIDTRRQMILRHIRTGKLKAKKVSSNPSYYLINGIDFINYYLKTYYVKRKNKQNKKKNSHHNKKS